MPQPMTKKIPLMPLQMAMGWGVDGGRGGVGEQGTAGVRRNGTCESHPRAGRIGDGNETRQEDPKKTGSKPWELSRGT